VAVSKDGPQYGFVIPSTRTAFRFRKPIEGRTFSRPFSLAVARLTALRWIGPAQAVETFAANTLPAALFLCCFAKHWRFS